MNPPRLQLSDWIAAVRRELEKAVIAQKLREKRADNAASELTVPPLAISNIELEATIESEASTSASGGVDVWVVTAEASKGKDSRTQQRVSINLKPTATILLGGHGEKENIF